MPLVRQLGDQEKRHRVQMAQGLCQVACREALPDRARARREDVQAAYPKLLEHLADPSRLRRGPPRRSHGQHLACVQQGRHPHRMHRQLRHRLPSRQDGELQGWGRLMRRIAPPDVLVCDGACGIGKVMRACWPGIKMQRCTFHVFCSIKRCTTTRPKTQAGIDLYALAKDLMHIETNT